MQVMNKTPIASNYFKTHKITAIKALGQHFLFNQKICNKIVQASPNKIEGKTVLEIGPGPGKLTKTILASNPKKLIIIEKDVKFIKQLKEIQALNQSKLEVIHGDALNFQLSDITATKVIIVSNLPYNIGTKLITSWLKQISYIECMVVMLQDEVVERIVAKYSSKTYGRLSIICQIIADTKKCFKVSPQAFTPPPKVHSSVISIIPKISKLDKHTLENVQKIIDLAFQTRRKQLKNCLKELLKQKNIKEEEIFNIKLNKRPEQLTPDEYIQLSKLLDY